MNKIPALDAQIMYRLTGRAHLETPGGHVIPLPRVALIGPLSAAARLITTDDFTAFGAVLRPHGLGVLRSVPARALVDRALALTSDEALRRAHAFKLAIGDPTDDAVRSELAHLFRRPAAHAMFNHDRARLVERWARSAANAHVADLSSILSLSPRQTARFTAATFGFTPHMLGMRHRAFSAARQIALSKERWPAAASDLFYDQSHLTNNVKRFVGETPARLARRDSIAKRCLLAAHDASGYDVE